MAKKHTGLYRPKYRDDAGTVKQSAVWWMRFSCRGCPLHPSGGKHRESTEKTGITDAKRERDKKVGAAASGQIVNPASAEKVTMDELFELVLTEYRTVPTKKTGRLRKTLYKIESELKLHLRPFFSGRRAQSLSEADIDTYKDKRRGEKASYASINNELAVLTLAFKLGLKKRKITGKLCIVERYSVDNARTGTFTEQQFHTLCKYLPPDVAAAVEFEFETGWRGNSEVLTRTWGHVDQQAGLIFLEAQETKNAKPRVYPYFENPRVNRIIDEQWSVHQQLLRRAIMCKWIFHHDGKALFYLNEKQGQKRPSAYFQNAWNKARLKAGVPNAIPHDFRRAAITRYEAEGISRKVAMQLSGHLTESVYDRYNIPDLSNLKQAVRKLNRTDEDSEKEGAK